MISNILYIVLSSPAYTLLLFEHCLHKYLCKLEQHQGIARATRSVSEQYIC